MLADWRDRDLPELDRARAVLAAGAMEQGDDDVDGLIELLNEPLTILPRLAGERLQTRDGVFVSADVQRQRLVRCPHPPSSFIEDSLTAATGRASCVDCGVVVAFADVGALAPELEGCALFRAPALPWPPSWLRIDERRVERTDRPLTVGGGPHDDVVNAGLPAAALDVTVLDDVIDVRCADGLLVTASGPGWLRRPASRVVAAMARPDLRAPLVTELSVVRAHDPGRAPVVVTVDAADPFAVEVVWRGFNATETLHVGDGLSLSFDHGLRALRTGSQVLIHTVGRAPWLVDLQPNARVELPLGAATATWRGRQLELVGCPPPPARAPAVNLLVSHVAGRRP